ncbi:shikimate kinase [Chloroflexota bacterium]
MKTNTALIGFMGVGKTVVGETLARTLRQNFVNLDSRIEEKTGRPIPSIFEQEGEIAFRELEIEATKEVSQEGNTVIACGGGIVLNQINIDRLRQKSKIVYLTASPRIIMKRVLSGGGERPLLVAANPSLRIQELLRFRRPFYERVADITVNTSKLKVDAVVEQIIAKIKEYEGFHS